MYPQQRAETGTVTANPGRSPGGAGSRNDTGRRSPVLEFPVPRARERLVDLRELLPAIGYTTESVRQLLRIPERVRTILSNTGRYSMFYLEDLEGIEAPAAVIAQLFLFGGRAPMRRFEQLPTPLRSLLCDFDHVEVVPDVHDALRGSVSITEVEGRYFLSDKLFENRGRGEFVVHRDPTRCMPPHASSLELLARLSTPPGARSLLDVGAGTGCQSILRATHYERVAGFDVSPRSVEFARANATLNGAEVSYSVADLRTFAEGEPYDHIAYNGDPEDVFTFINESMDRLLSPDGAAQIWTRIPVTLAQGSVDGTLRERLRAYGELDIDVAEIDMPFSLSREQMQARRLPRDSLLIAHPSEREAFFSRLVQAGVSEIVPVVLTIRRRNQSALRSAANMSLPSSA
jgi:SAM-dependent methyltransferase